MIEGHLISREFAFRIRQLLNNPDMAKPRGERGKSTCALFADYTQVCDYFSTWYALVNPTTNIMEIPYA